MRLLEWKMNSKMKSDGFTESYGEDNIKIKDETESARQIQSADVIIKIQGLEQLSLGKNISKIQVWFIEEGYF